MIDREPTANGSPSASRAVKGKSLREQVITSLRWSIFIGDLPPGRQFSVPVLAEQFGVSPTPVREAVLELAQQGLVVAVANRGFQVVAPSMDYLLQAMHVRKLLEIPAMIAIARACSPEQIAPVRELAESIMAAAEAGEIRAFVETDYAFHWQLTSLCGNDVLTNLIEEMRSRARVVVIPAISRQLSLVAIAQEHLDLLTAISKHDLPTVERVTIAHMDRTLDGIRNVMDAPAG
ncbi:MAG: GntR family transcriptional regulator [Chloroflexota bacterium]